MVDAILVFIILINFWLLSTSRLAAFIRAVAAQGIALGLLLLLSHSEEVTVRVIIVALISMGIKGVVFPRLLNRTLNKVNVKREVEPYVGYTLSILAGVAGLLLSLWLGSRLRVPGPMTSTLAVPAAFSTMLTGFFLIISRRKALTQVIGYLVAENGIYAFGAAAVHASSIWVELGILLDVLVGVFVMGIAIHHISQEFESIDVDRFSALKD